MASPAQDKGKPKAKGQQPKSFKGKRKKPANLQAHFVDEFMIDRNATQAAIRCGYSPRSAGAQGSRLLKKSNILSEINKRSAEISTRLQITADRVMQEYERLALLDPLDLFNPDGTMKALVDMPEDARRAIAGMEICQVKVTQSGEARVESHLKKIKLVDKKGALDSISKIMGMMREQVEHSGTVTVVTSDTDERL